MSYRFLNNVATADVAFEARGASLDELFLSAWEAALRTMIENPLSINAKSTRYVSIAENRLDFLLHDFLQKLLFFKDANSELHRVKTMQLTNEQDGYTIRAQLVGESIDPLRHHMSVDVKAVTFHRLAVVECKSGWRATVVLDV